MRQAPSHAMNVQRATTIDAQHAIKCRRIAADGHETSINQRFSTALVANGLIAVAAASMRIMQRFVVAS
jgi:hypothetical protein